MNSTASTDFPALDGRPVTERHARTCREQGHALHTVDGVHSEVCPRCGEVLACTHGDAHLISRDPEGHGGPEVWECEDWLCGEQFTRVHEHWLADTKRHAEDCHLPPFVCDCPSVTVCMDCDQFGTF